MGIIAKIRDNRLNKIKERMTENEAVKLVGEEIARYIKCKNDHYLEWLIAESVDAEMYSYVFTLCKFKYREFRDKKTEIAYNKFEWTLPLQLKLLYYLKNHKDLEVNVILDDEYIHENSIGITGFNGLYQFRLKSI